MLIPKCCKGCSGRKNGVCNCTLPTYCQEYVEDEEAIIPYNGTISPQSEPKQWWGTDGTDGTGQYTHRMMTTQDLGNWVQCPDCEDFKKQIKEKDKEIKICKERIEELAEQRENLHKEADMLNCWKETYYKDLQKTTAKNKEKNHRIAVLEKALWNTIPFCQKKRKFKKRYEKAEAQAEKELEEKDAD